MTTDYRALLLELVEAWESYSYADAGDATDRMSEAVEAEPLSAVEYARELEIRKARAVLQRWGRPTIEPKATKEDVLDWLRQDRAWGTVIAPTMWRRPEDDELLDLLQRAIARFGRPAVESEPAGERLPVFEEVDAEHFG